MKNYNSNLEREKRRKNANKTKHSKAQMIRNTKKKSDSGFKGITALYKFSSIHSVEGSYHGLLVYKTM
jgi:hypothetical protein